MQKIRVHKGTYRRSITAGVGTLGFSPATTRGTGGQVVGLFLFFLLISGQVRKPIDGFLIKCYENGRAARIRIIILSYRRT